MGRRSRADGSMERKGGDRVVERMLGGRGDDVAGLPGALEVA